MQQGAKLVAGGEHEGNFFSPTVITEITPDNDAYREEFFGPVAQVYRVSSEEEAVKLANDTPFGLGSYVFTNDAEQARRVADGLDAGMVYINAVGAEGAELPFGGVKRSGFGRELGRYGADEFVNKKLIRIGTPDSLEPADPLEVGALHALGQAALLGELVEVGRERDRGREPQLPGDIAPGRVEQLLHAAPAGIQRREQPPLAVEPMVDVLVELLRGVGGRAGRGLGRARRESARAGGSAPLDRPPARPDRERRTRCPRRAPRRR